MSGSGGTNPKRSDTMRTSWDGSSKKSWNPDSYMSASMTSASIPSVSRGGSVKVAKFCHECGNPFALPDIRFCCECGVKRLYCWSDLEPFCHMGINMLQARSFLLMHMKNLSRVKHYLKAFKCLCDDWSYDKKLQACKNILTKKFLIGFFQRKLYFIYPNNLVLKIDFLSLKESYKSCQFFKHF